VVLIRRSGVLGLLLLGGCGRLLFDSHGGGSGDGGSGSNDVPSTCPAGCIADAAADFNAASGIANHWRYLDDHRDRSWTPMAVTPTERIGSDPGNRITTCAANPSAPACRALPGALLVSTAGSSSNADPAIEFTAPGAQVIQLSLHALVPSGADQAIRLYRNSREDVLFTGTAPAGTTLARAFTLDAIAGDRFLVAVAPMGGGATEVGLQLFVNATGAPFPSTCQLALPFTSASSTTTTDRCRGTVFTHETYAAAPPPTPGTITITPLTLGNGPFSEQGSAVDLKPTGFLEPKVTDVLDWSHDTTVQFWVQLRTTPTFATSAWLFSDQDPDFGGGIGVSLTQNGGGGVNLSVTACTDPTPNMVNFGTVFAAYPAPGSWQFVRVVRAGGAVDVCLNGQHIASLPVSPSLPPTFQTYNPPALGIEDSPSPGGAFFDGLLDDVRVMTGALPCS
jgi:concanavalin A-like lectin/glucanase superfamily protein